MATAPTLPNLSVEEYLRTDYEPHCEYLDGALLSKPVPDYLHAKLQSLLLLWLSGHTEDFGIEVLAELHLRITPTRFRVPDVCGLIRRPTQTRYPDADAPPLFTIEIASLDEPWSVLHGKVRDHLSAGVSTVIIADPHSRTVLVANRDEPLHEVSVPLAVTIPVPGKGDMTIDFDDLYSRLN